MWPAGRDSRWRCRRGIAADRQHNLFGSPGSPSGVSPWRTRRWQTHQLLEMDHCASFQSVSILHQHMPQISQRFPGPHGLVRCILNSFERVPHWRIRLVRRPSICPNQGPKSLSAVRGFPRRKSGVVCRWPRHWAMPAAWLRLCARGMGRCRRIPAAGLIVSQSDRPLGRTNKTPILWRSVRCCTN